MVGTNVPVSSQRPQGVSLNGHQFIRVKDAAKVLSVSLTQCRILADAGELGPVRRSLGKHRYLSQRHVRNYAFNGDAYCDDEVQRKGDVVPLALVCRVSSRGQAVKSSVNASKSSLDHQIERVEGYANERWGQEALENATRYYRVGSGLNHQHETLVQLVRDILAGKFRGGYCVAQDDLRVMRFGTAMFEEICRHGECEIAYTHPEEMKDTETDLTHSILGIITFFTAKASGLRAKRILKINLDEQSLSYALDLHRRGYSFRHIGRIFQEEDRRDEKGRLYKANIIRKCIQENLEVLEATLGDEHRSSFEEFAKQKIRRTGSRTKLPLKKLMSQYRRWCAQNGTAPMTPNKISEVIRTELGWKEGFDSTKCRIFFGLKIC